MSYYAFRYCWNIFLPMIIGVYDDQVITLHYFTGRRKLYIATY